MRVKNRKLSEVVGWDECETVIWKEDLPGRNWKEGDVKIYKVLLVYALINGILIIRVYI